MSTNIRKEKTMAKTHSYACRDYPGMEACPAQVTAETEDEVWKLMELYMIKGRAINIRLSISRFQVFLRSLGSSIPMPK